MESCITFILSHSANDMVSSAGRQESWAFVGYEVQIAAATVLKKLPHLC